MPVLRPQSDQYVWYVQSDIGLVGSGVEATLLDAEDYAKTFVDDYCWGEKTLTRKRENVQIHASPSLSKTVP